MPEIFVYAAEGRTVEQKKALMKDLTDAIVRNWGVRPASVTVQIIESPKTSKAKAGIAFDDIAQEMAKGRSIPDILGEGSAKKGA
jgi:4-oxalocrotonate tautomerase